jgi:hypothetical protein
MQIEIDFDVFKALTALRDSEVDSYNSVIRRLLNLPSGMMKLSDLATAGTRFGLWLGDVHFPEGTKFRATYKGQTYTAEIKNDKWVDQDGTPRNSPSEAAGAISGTNVNGWRFWHAQRPGDPTWRRLDDLK